MRAVITFIARLTKRGAEAHDHSSFISVAPYRKLGHCFIPCIPLDSVLYQFQSRRVSVVKIDVEGFECEVLLGAKAFLARHRPVVIVEAWRVYQEKVFHLMKDMGYGSPSKLADADHFMDDYVFYPDVRSNTVVSSVFSERT
jgi:hypothetical protein